MDAYCLERASPSLPESEWESDRVHFFVLSPGTSAKDRPSKHQLITTVNSLYNDIPNHKKSIVIKRESLCRKILLIED